MSVLAFSSICVTAAANAAVSLTTQGPLLPSHVCDDAASIPGFTNLGPMKLFYHHRNKK